MILKIIANDHRTARETFARAGPISDNAKDDSGAAFARFATFWRAHNTMMSGVVFPALARAGDTGEYLSAVRAAQAQVEGLIQNLLTLSPHAAAWSRLEQLLCRAVARQCDAEAHIVLDKAKFMFLDADITNLNRQYWPRHDGFSSEALAVTMRRQG